MLKVGRYALMLYPCGCSVVRISETGRVASAGLCDGHLEDAQAGALMTGMGCAVAILGGESGKPSVVDTVRMGGDFADYVAAHSLREEDGVDGHG